MKKSDAPLISIRWEKRAFKEFKALGRQDQNRVFKAVEELRASPLKGKMMSAQWKGLRRIRVGDIRVIYAFDGRQLLISVIRVGHRRDVYKTR